MYNKEVIIQPHRRVGMMKAEKVTVKEIIAQATYGSVCEVDTGDKIFTKLAYE